MKDLFARFSFRARYPRHKLVVNFTEFRLRSLSSNRMEILTNLNEGEVTNSPNSRLQRVMYCTHSTVRIMEDLCIVFYITFNIGVFCLPTISQLNLQHLCLAKNCVVLHFSLSMSKIYFVSIFVLEDISLLQAFFTVLQIAAAPCDSG